MSSVREPSVRNVVCDGKTLATSLVRKCGSTRDPRGMAEVLLAAALKEVTDAKLSSDKIMRRFPSLPALEDGEFYVWRVIGLPAITEGVPVGVVVEVHASGPLDVFEIKTDDGVFFVPALKEMLTVDVEGGRVILSADALVEG